MTETRSGDSDPASACSSECFNESLLMDICSEPCPMHFFTPEEVKWAISINAMATDEGSSWKSLLYFLCNEIRTQLNYIREAQFCMVNSSQALFVVQISLGSAGFRKGEGRTTPALQSTARQPHCRGLAARWAPRNLQLHCTGTGGAAAAASSTETPLPFFSHSPFSADPPTCDPLLDLSPVPSVTEAWSLLPLTPSALIKLYQTQSGTHCMTQRVWSCNKT